MDHVWATLNSGMKWSVPAYRVGVLAIHRPLMLLGKNRRQWVLTHIPSGCALGKFWFGRQAKAAACAREMQRCHPGLPWDRETLSRNTIRSFKRALWPILRRRSDGEHP